METTLTPNKWHPIEKRSQVYCQPGLYAIFYKKNGKNYLAYIGRASNLYKRILGCHPILTDIRNAHGIDNVFFKVKYTTEYWLEKLLIHKLKPKFNTNIKIKKHILV